jgi:PPOX class probable F420-dependent enzyme
VPVPADPFWREFIDALPAKTAKIATVAADGSPRVTPIWVALDGDDVMFTTHETSAKAKALARNPGVALCFDDEQPPFTYVIVRGEASMSDDLEQLRHWATILGGRYMGAGRADEYGARNGIPGELLMRVRPSKVIIARDIAS